MVLFVMLYKVILSFAFVEKILKCDRSNETELLSISCGAVVMPYKVVLTLAVVDKILKCDQSHESY